MNINKKGFTPFEIARPKGPAGAPARARFQTGFTLVELLVVVAIIGLLSSIVTVALNNARTKARDARRISDMKQVKTGLDLYYSSGAGYPDTAAWVVGATLSCSGTSIMRVPQDPVSASYSYVYTPSGSSRSGCGAATVRSDYDLEFYMENKGRYYIMDEDGQVRDKITGAPVSFDTLL